MSTSNFLVCDAHREVVQVSYHRALPTGHPDTMVAVAQFCFRHAGCTLRVVNEHASEPYGYDRPPLFSSDEHGCVPMPDEPPTPDTKSVEVPVVLVIDEQGNAGIARDTDVKGYDGETNAREEWCHLYDRYVDDIPAPVIDVHRLTLRVVPPRVVPGSVEPVGVVGEVSDAND